MLYGELIPLCLDYFFFFASEIQQIRNKKTPQILSRDFPCVKTIPNVRMVQCRLKDNTQVLWII